jgi:hypothetical protein
MKEEAGEVRLQLLPLRGSNDIEQMHVERLPIIAG